MAASKIRIGIVGLTDTGEIFAEHLLELIQVRGIPAEIAAVAHDNPESPVAMGFQQNGVPVFADPTGIVAVEPPLDVVFELSGNPANVQKLRMAYLGVNNLHSYVVPKTVAALVWHLFGEQGAFPIPDA